MDLNQVTLKIPVSDIVPITLEHANHSNSGERKHLYCSAPEKDYIRHEYVYSDFEVLLNFSPKIEITSITIPIGQSISTVDGHNTFIIFVEGTGYNLSSNDDPKQNIRVPDAAINHINNYKSTYKKFPTIKFQICTHFYIDSGNTEMMSFYMYSPAVICNFNGGQGVYRPSADIEVGHAIPNGFSGIYELLDEEVTDDSFTEICEEDDTSTSSTVLVKVPIKKAAIQQIRLVSRMCVTEEGDARGEVEFYISVNDSGGIPFGTYQSAGYLPTAWVEGEYYTFESVIPSDAEVYKDIESYYKINKTMPPLEIRIVTTGDSSNGYGGDKTGSAHVSQVYLEIVYENITNIGIFDKIQSDHKAATAAYKKVGGTWTEISEDEAKATIKNNTIRRG